MAAQVAPQHHPRQVHLQAHETLTAAASSRRRLWIEEGLMEATKLQIQYGGDLEKDVASANLRGWKGRASSEESIETSGEVMACSCWGTPR
jgi:hypothetical protein